MGRETWKTIINSKTFYVRTYRVAARSLVISLLINLFLSLLIYYCYFNEPIRDYYATSGITPPIQLSPMLEPNYSAAPLLPPDPADETTIKSIPD